MLLSTCLLTASAQSKKDSLKLKRDIEAIRQGKPVKPDKEPSIMRTGDKLPAKIDTAALKPNSPVPTPPSPNNPNPYSPRPGNVHPNPPANPPSNPTVPPGTPKGPDSTPEKKDG